jgi:translation elongation factor EF-Tu-like GTPase
MFSERNKVDYSKGPWWYILAKAKVSLLPTASGGRRKPVYEKYSPAHRLAGGRSCNGTFESIDGGIINPGESGFANIRFVVIEPLRILFREGLVWEIHEGSGKVGTGQIVSVIETKEAGKPA